MEQDWTKEKKIAARLFAIASGCAALYFVTLAATTVQSAQFIGLDIPPQATISVSGEGKALVTPDIAEISFAVVSEKPTVAEAQQEVALKFKAIRVALGVLKVDEKDIRSEGYNVSPRYEFETKESVRPVTCVGCPPPVNGEQVLKGYVATQSVLVKVRDIAGAGKVIDALGVSGATNIGGVNLLVEDPLVGRNEARAKAIAVAQKQANILASQLGVQLVRVVSFNENGGAYPQMMYAKAMDSSSMPSPVPATDIPLGESTISSSVSVVYEIR